MSNFIPTPFKQDIIVVTNLEEQLIPGTFEHALHYLFEEAIDLSEFHLLYKNTHGGRAAYRPAVLLKIILYAYAKGVTSSRKIAHLCKYHLTFKALSCQAEPHFTTIANFVSSHSAQVAALFEQVLNICDECGLIGKELFAIDGCKMPSNAAKTWSGTHKELREKHDKLKKLVAHHMEKHAACDSAEKHEETIIQQQRHLKAVKTLTAAAEKIQRFLAENEPRMGKGKTPKEVKSNITDNESAKMKTSSKGNIQGFNGVATVDHKHQVIVDAQAFGEGQEQHLLQPIIETLDERLKRLNLSAGILGQSTIITADTGLSSEANNQYLFENEINAFIPDNQFRQRDPRFSEQKKKYGKRKQDERITQGEFFKPSEFTFDETAKTCLCPAGETMGLHHEGCDKNENVKLFFEGPVSKCRHCPLKEQCMRNPGTADKPGGKGRQVSFIIGKTTKRTNFTEWMKNRIDTDEGKAIYAHRMSTVEPVFANIEHNKGLKRFSLRGKEKVQGQWQLFCLVHNIEKLNNYGKMFNKMY